jgi:hypothetical protein
VISINSDFDKKSKLNKCEKKVPNSFLEQIENGITIEGIKTNKLNKYDKFLFDVHAIILGKAPELPRHASKSSSFGIYMSKYYTENGVDNLILSIKDTARWACVHRSSIVLTKGSF